MFNNSLQTLKFKISSLVVLLFIIPLLLILNTTPFYSSVRNSLLSACKPALETAHFIFFNLADGLSRMGEYAEVYRTNQQLTNDLTQLREKLVDYNELAAENARLSVLLNLNRMQTHEHITAQVIGKDASPWAHWVIINVGSENGISENMPIIAPGGLVGCILAVGTTTARCILLVDPQAKVSALVQETRDSGIVEGRGDETLIMKYLPLDTEAQVGDTVITSGLGGIYPKEIPVGTITVIGTDKNGLHLFAHIKPFVDFTKLEEVVCLKKSS